MIFFLIIYLFPAALLASIFALQANAQESDDMGPAAFLWPPDRRWSATEDNTPPCGSSAGVTNRTKFPLTNGAVALVLQDDSYNINLAISYSNNPTSNSDFSTIVSSKYFPELYPGHECYAVPNPPSNIVSGSNATLQIQYVSTFDTSQTFYACSDITYVPLSQFMTDIPCFNVSTEDPDITSSKIGGATTTSTGTSTARATAVTSNASGLSGGAIAGIVVGTVVGASLVSGALFILWRRYRQRVRRQKAVEFRMNELTVEFRMNELTNPAK